MAILIETNLPDWMTNEALQAFLRPALPEVDIRAMPDMGNPTEIEMLVCTRLPAGLARQLPNLRLVQKLGAGVDAIVHDPDLPPHVQVTRLKPEAAANEIAEYCVAYVLHEQRNIRFHEEKQAAGEWVSKAPREAHKTTVGVLGLGHIGGRTARTFANLGFRVFGWSRTRKEIEGVECRSGPKALYPLLAECDYIASILPATPQTNDLFNQDTFAVLKPNAVLINAGRGSLVVEEDLLTALDAGQLGRAILDVVRTEPPPVAHPFWTHPKVTLTPHVSGWHVDDGLQAIADNYQRLQDGRPLLHQVDRAAGY